MSNNYTELNIERVGDVTIESVQDEFDIDLTNLVYISQVSPAYHRLTRDDIHSICERLQEKYSEEGVDEVESLFRKMKRGSYEPQTSQTYEWLVRNALEAPGSIRGEGESVQELPDDATDIYQDHYRITQAFLRNEFSRSKTLYRGLYPEEFLPLVRAMLDHAYKPAFVSRSPVVTSFSLSKSIAENFCQGVRMDWPLQDNAVAFAADFLRQPPNSCRPEGEMHVMSGALILSPERFQLCLSEEKQLISVIRRMATPKDLSESSHQDLLVLLEELAKAKLQTNTTQATYRLWRWYRYCERHDVFKNKQKQSIAKGSVTAISGERDWDIGAHDVMNAEGERM